ncbi:immunity 53 family protein [Deinococcus sp.]|uniref:immunity 53 family protein n=1 Tax=Deinococcus sp. TaxID=47478 RepID=UPI003B5B320C
MLASENPLEWLQGWYYAMCDGDWEHQSGPKISTVDNPGWTLKVNLLRTGLEAIDFEKLVIERDEHNWIHCKVSEGHFYGYGGPLNLGELINVFRDWAQPHLVIRDFPSDDVSQFSTEEP